ncbi:MAG: glycosyltransferase [Bacteroidia bacterium]
MKKVLFLGCMYPHDRLEELNINSITSIDYAANNLQWALVKGLDYFYPDMQIITLPAIQSFPLKYKKFRFKESKFSHNINSDDLCLGFVNFPILKHFSRYYSIKKKINEIFRYQNEVLIIIYSIQTPFLAAIKAIIKSGKKIKVCLIVPDLPQYMSDNTNHIYLFLKKIDIIMIKKLIVNVNYFVFLTQHMAKALHVENKPNVTIEGIFDPLISFQTSRPKQQKTILYTGTLAQRYGILYLLEAFSKIKDREYKLWICGDGDTNEIIKEAAKTDSRILFMGLKPHKEILELQQCASVLVNPRTSEGEFTKYSFPSKTMEYLASGTPTVLFKLEGIPNEYFKHCFVVEEETIDALKNTIIEVCEMDEKLRLDIGLKAKSFIFEKKNPKIQCEKIIKMLDKI